MASPFKGQSKKADGFCCAYSNRKGHMITKHSRHGRFTDVSITNVTFLSRVMISLHARTVRVTWLVTSDCNHVAQGALQFGPFIRQRAAVFSCWVDSDL